MTQGHGHPRWRKVGVWLLPALGLAACDGGGTTPTALEVRTEPAGGALEQSPQAAPGEITVCPETLLVDAGGSAMMFTVAELPSVSCSTKVHNNRNTMTVHGTLPPDQIPDRNERLSFSETGYYCAVPYIPPGGQSPDFEPTDDWTVRLTTRGDLVARCVLPT